MRLFKKTAPLSPDEKKRRLQRRVVAYGSLTLLVVGFYFYQPQRYHFFPKAAPSPNPPVDPDSSRLFSKGVKIVLVQAHPDDSEFFIGPLLLRLAASGAEIHQLVMTDGDKGFYFWERENIPENRRIREAEQREAASHYAKEVTFLHKPDGRLAGQTDNAEQVRAYIQQVKPEYVLAFDTEYWPRVNHADHLASGAAAWQAVHAIPPSQRTVKWMLLYDSAASNFVPDVSNTVDEGEAMIGIHKSQFYGKRLEIIKNSRLNYWYNAGQTANESYGVPLRAVQVTH
jgi:LmbE family N-acetylglucosaminyl deacetylase